MGVTSRLFSYLREGQFMTIISRVTAIALLTVAGIIASCAIVLPVSRAATGAPDITDFTKDSVVCGGGIGSNGFIPWMEFGGLLETASESLLRVTTESDKSFTNVLVDGVVVRPLATNKIPSGFDDGNYYRLPPWNGRQGYQPILYVSVTGVAPSDDVAFDMAWVGKSEFAPIATGQANERCTLMGNPIPAHQS